VTTPGGPEGVGANAGGTPAGGTGGPVGPSEPVDPAGPRETTGAGSVTGTGQPATGQPAGSTTGTATGGPTGTGPTGTASHAAKHEVHHWWRLIAVWVVLSAIADPLFYYLAGPHIPPGTMSNTASGAQFDFNILFIIAVPVLLAVWIYMIYAIFMWRAGRGGPEPVGGPEARGNYGVQLGWILTTTVVVLFLAGFGTYELVQPGGAGGGQGPDPIWTPDSHAVLPVQVIGQQWKWTFRYPSFGGFETNRLVIPVDVPIAFHVTSLDVVHSFWAYQLGVKADANPGQDNVAFTTPEQTGQFIVRCAELCGLWHGSMFTTGYVVTKAQFVAWAHVSRRLLARNTRLLPPFAYSYTPDANSADGGYYPDNVDPYSKVEVYGSPQPGGTPRPTSPKALPAGTHHTSEQ
jgi:cytochrome c oxidase subunit II